MTGLQWTALALCALAVLAVALTAFGTRRWASARSVLAAQLEAGRIESPQGSAATRYGARELEGLPAPVQRYFRAVLKDGQPIIRALSLEVGGTFNLSATGEQWKPFTSTQRVLTHRPGFLWDARIVMLPGLSVRVVDSYIGGHGLLRAALQGLFKLADMQGDGEIARGEFMRWFAEAPWYPTALLPSQGVRWSAVDAHSALASVEDGPLGLSLLFRFDDAGLIGSFRAEARGAMVGDRIVMAPWEGRWSNYRVHDGMRVPCTGEVAWMRLEGRRPYFVGTVSRLAYEFAP